VASRLCKELLADCWHWEGLARGGSYSFAANSIGAGARKQQDYREGMPEPTGIPLADIFRTANELVSSGLINDYALGGALAAMRYVEPFATYDADIFFVPATKDLSAGVHDIYEALRARGCEIEGDHLLLKNFPVQFLAADGLTEEAIQRANEIDYQGVHAKVFRPEYIIAIAASVRRPKDLARIKLFMEQADIDRDLLNAILKRHKLSLPKDENGNPTPART